MKKLFSLLLAALMLLSLCACGDDSADPTTPPKTPTPNENGYVLVYKGQNLRIHADFAPILTALGQPVSYTEGASCAFEGMRSKTYYYGNIYIETYLTEGKEYIALFWFADDSITTPEGIYIGATKAQVEAAYGTESFNGSNAFNIIKSGEELTIILENDVVTSIQYAPAMG